MTPFPETEIMTIKRLEVALRKMDYKLLKDGAYKLHEKFHGGHRFEYLDLLKEILNNVCDNNLIPQDAKGILIPTIEDILSSSNTTKEEQDFSGERISSLTSLSYTVPQEPKEQNAEKENDVPQVENANEGLQEQNNEIQIVQEMIEQKEKITAFSAFGATSATQTQAHQEQANVSLQTQEVVQQIKPQVQQIQEQSQIQQQRTFTQSPFSAQPFKEFVNPLRTQPISIAQPTQAQMQTQIMDDETVKENTSVQEKKVEKELKPIAIFYNQNSSFEKNKNILILREEIAKINNKDISLNKIIELTTELNIQTDNDVSALESVLEQLKQRKNRVNLITNTQSSNLTKLFEKIGLEYSFLIPKEERNFNVIPILGLSNLFVCSECSEEYLDVDSKITSLVLQCPKCKKPMFANVYAAKGVNSEINLNYYNAAMLSLVNSKVWVLVSPSLEDKFSINVLRNALKMSNSVEEIYIFNKDINTKEQYKNMFYEINEKVKVDIQTTALEEFLNSIK